MSKFLLLVAALVGATASAAFAGAEVSDFTLANGLEVVVVPDHRAPVVTQSRQAGSKQCYCRLQALALDRLSVQRVGAPPA